MTAAWDIHALNAAVLSGLRAHAEALDLEQAVYGIDSEAELGLHPLLADALQRGGWGVQRECCYPSDRRKSKRTEGARCDLVLTHDAAPLAEPGTAGTLFAGAHVPPEAAFWLEVKTVAQFESGNVFPRYAAELNQPVMRDLAKLRSDPRIVHGGLLLVLFTRDGATAEHDISYWLRRVGKKQIPLADVAVGGFRLNDRTGNGWCGTALVQTGQP